ncbi:MAG: hypothetical protein J7L53_06070 [Deltaproteobacteria bacterium]|nr:hypothetical protein [Deltaproteobacteria bacterium]
MLQRLFSSRVRVEILSSFFLHPDKDLYVREIERITGEDYKNISRELRNLEEIGLLSSRKKGNLKYFALDKEFLLYEELRSVFLKTRGAAAVLKKVLSEEADIEFAFIYGSIASGRESENSDIGLMVLGKIPLENLLKLIRKPEGLLSRDINPSPYTLPETIKRFKDNDPFITEVMNSPRIMLVGDEDELRRLIE